jgi:hypothetical protein
LEVIEESPQITPDESPDSSSENSPVKVSEQQRPPSVEAVNEGAVVTLSVKSISPSNALFSERQTPDTDTDNVYKAPAPVFGYADFDPSQFTRVFPIRDASTSPSTSPKLVDVKSIVSIPGVSSEDEQEKENEETIYISPIPSPRSSAHQGSLKELQERRMAKQREREKLRSASGSPADPEADHSAFQVSRISESYSPPIMAYPKRLSLDVPDLAHTPRRSPTGSPVTQLRSSVGVSDSMSIPSSPVSERPVSAKSSMENIFTSPNSRRRLSTKVRRSKAFASFFGSKREEIESPVDSNGRRMSLAQSRKRSSDASQSKQKRRSTLTKIADAVVSAFIKKSAETGESHKRPKKEKVAQSIVNRQFSQPIETPSFVIDELSPDQEEAVIQPLPAQIIPPPLVRMGRGRRSSILPGTEPPQVVMRKMDAKKQERPRSGISDGPKIDDVVFTVNTKGEMEMFEVVPVAQPTVPTG